jgi:hypothetical protein
VDIILFDSSDDEDHNNDIEEEPVMRVAKNTSFLEKFSRTFKIRKTSLYSRNRRNAFSSQKKAMTTITQKKLGVSKELSPLEKISEEPQIT